MQRRLAAEARRNVREAERQAKTDAKEAARDHLAAQLGEVEALTHEICDREGAIEYLLAHALTRNPMVDLNAKLKTFRRKTFNEAPWTSADRKSVV